mmetsp:Transcript_25625/g.82214  ORF Transcript_25625/g.82214 Transcript_25625/m.82214 type:complete len:225 (-) Transcript_25625:230-904(-)
MAREDACVCGVYQSEWGLRSPPVRSSPSKTSVPRWRGRPLCSVRTRFPASGLEWPRFVCVGVPCADHRPHVHVFAVNIAHSSLPRLSRRPAHHMHFEDGEDTKVRGAERELPLLRGRSKPEAAHVAQQRAGLAPAAVPRAGAEQSGVGVRRRPHPAPPHPAEQREGVREGRLANRLRGEAERRARVDALEPLVLPASAARDRLSPLEQLRRRRRVRCAPARLHR